MDAGELQRAFFDAIYTYRLVVGVGTAVFAVGAALVAWRLGWFGAARRHFVRAAIVMAIGLSVALPLGYYVASPLWIRTELIEPDPVAIVDPSPTVIPSPARGDIATPVASASAIPSTATSANARRLTSGSFHGTDDFHFGRGTATIIETAPGVYTLRLDAFSVRNGPDLYVYLSPSARDYVKGAVELGRLKATDGAFGYELPRGTDPAAFASAIIWCKQFSHLFAVAPLEPI